MSDKQTVLANLTPKQLRARKRALVEKRAPLENIWDIDAYLRATKRKPLANPVLK